MKHFLACVILLVAWANPAWADSFYCLLFAYDSKPVPMPCKSHVWGSFVRLDDQDRLKEVVTISWEPDKRSYLNRSRPGYNATLHETLDHGVKNNRTIRMFGPFETDEEFFNKAKVLHCDQGRYRFLDACTRKTAMNCIHRLSDLAGPHKTGIYWGWWAADSVCKHFRRQGVIRETPNRSKVFSLLKLDAYRIVTIGK